MKVIHYSERFIVQVCVTKKEAAAFYPALKLHRFTFNKNIWSEAHQIIEFKIELTIKEAALLNTLINNLQNL